MSAELIILRTFTALVVLAAGTARAEKFVSEKYGFEFEVPAGFEEWSDGEAITIKAFAEVDSGDENPISIRIQHLGEEVNPTHRVQLADLPEIEGITSSLETRRWLKTELQVLRQEGSVPPGIEIVGYLIQFPLRDEAVQIRVLGPRSRAAEIAKVFDESIQSFVNLKPYIVSVERVEPGRASRAVIGFLTSFLVPCLLVAMVAFFVIRIRKSQVKSQ